MRFDFPSKAFAEQTAQFIHGHDLWLESKWGDVLDHIRYAVFVITGWRERVAIGQKRRPFTRGVPRCLRAPICHPGILKSE